MGCFLGSAHTQEWDFTLLPEGLYTENAGDCRWKTNHNSFMSSLQIGRASRGEVVRVLGNGYRVIEIDIHERSHGLEVSHGRWTNGLALRDVLQDIADNAFRGTDYPLVIACDSSVRTPAGHEAVADHFKHAFPHSLLERQSIHQFHQTKLFDLRCRVIVCSYADAEQPGLGKVSALKFEQFGVYNTCMDTLPDINTRDWSVLTNRSSFQMVRLYPDNLICSHNPNPTKGLASGAQ